MSPLYKEKFTQISRKGVEIHTHTHSSLLLYYTVTAS